MKVFVVVGEDKAILKKNYSFLVRKCHSDYEENPDRYGGVSIDELTVRWYDKCRAEAVFKLLERDGLATITKERDAFYSFSAAVGACYHELFVMGEKVKSIGLFEGDDFYGSGYDADFYSAAIEKLKTVHPHYINEALKTISD